MLSSRNLIRSGGIRHAGILIQQCKISSNFMFQQQRMLKSTKSNSSKTQNSTSIAPTTTAARSRKMLPTTKAKAQASASRKLREQLHQTQQTPIDVSSDEIESSTERIAEDENQNAIPSLASEFPTSRRLNDVFAFATAENYDFEKLITSGRLPTDWQLVQNDEVIYIPKWPIKLHSASSSSSSSSQHTGEAFIFRSGGYVTWGLNNDQSRKFHRSIIRGHIPSHDAEIKTYSEIGDEGMEFLLDDEQITRVVGDVIVIGLKPQTEEELEGDYVNATSNSIVADDDWSPLLARLAFSQGLCRSARLSVQEAALSDYLEEMSDIPARLEAEGEVRIQRKQVIRKMGTLLKLRQSANLDTENFLDDPEMYWENWELEHHYDSICQALEIEERFKAYNEKLDHGENLLEVLRALLTEKSTHRMELIIIYLIAFEVCIALISHEYIPSISTILKFFQMELNQDVDAQEFENQNANHPIIETSNINRENNTLKTSFWQWIYGFPKRQTEITTSKHVV